MLINCDLKQIEVCVFAQLCKPKLLIERLNSGKDVHKFIGSNVFNVSEEEVSDEQRSDAKTSTFGIIYGNGAKTLSERTGRDFEWCKGFIQEFYELFPEAKAWHNEIIKRVEQTGCLKLFTGEILKFNKYPAKYDWQKQKGIIESYNPPDIKNYPVQHLAWVITSIILGQIYRIAVHKRNKYLLINTVHDSIMIDARPDDVDEAINDLILCVDKVKDIIYTKFNERLIVPIKMDVSIGDDWLTL